MGLDDLRGSENRIETKMGAWFPGERVVFRGRDLHEDIGEWPWLKLYLYGVTGREFNDSELTILNYLMVCSNYPDARLWCNRVAALAGSVRSTATLGVGSAMITWEASLYGVGPLVRALDFFQRSLPVWQHGNALSELISRELKETGIPLGGYGRPIAKVDERIPPLMAFLRRVGVADGPHIQLAQAVEECLKPKGIRMNVGALAAAVCADLDFTVREFHSFATLLTLAGMPPVFLEAQSNPPGTFLPMRCSYLHYTGPERRAWRTD